MKFQDYAVESIRKAYADVFKAARQVPEDKLTWRPLDEGRSVLDQLQEIAQSPYYVIGMVTGDKSQEMGEGDWEKVMAERKAWTTIDACEAVANERLEQLLEAIRACSDERLEQTQWLPYDGGRDFTIKEIIDYPRWNANYHLGQISYIQTLYGDREMR